jgi:hypothetical protein
MQKVLPCYHRWSESWQQLVTTLIRANNRFTSAQCGVTELFARCFVQPASACPGRAYAAA